MSEIIIVGAGVVGLATAYELSLAVPDHTIIILAQELPNALTVDLKSDPMSSQYTSTKAGAHFRPFPSITESDEREMQYTRVTQRKFRKFSVEEPESSIRFIDGIEYFEDPSQEYLQLKKGYTEEIESFQVIPADQLPKGINFGTKYKTWVLNPPVFLKFLCDKLVSNNRVKFVKQKLSSLKQVFTEYPRLYRLINCSGTGLQYDGGNDPACFSIRGQTLVLKTSQDNYFLDKTVTYQLRDNVWCFNIPRPLGGGMILGGTKKKLSTTDNGKPIPFEEETHQLWRNGVKYFPELIERGNMIQRVNVGYRPARHGGSLVGVDNRHPKIINAYGVGGAGFEMSFGIAEKICQILLESFQNDAARKPKL